MGVSTESISKFLIENRFHVKQLILSSLLTPIVESTLCGSLHHVPDIVHASF